MAKTLITYRSLLNDFNETNFDFPFKICIPFLQVSWSLLLHFDFSSHNIYHCPGCYIIYEFIMVVVYYHPHL